MNFKEWIESKREELPQAEKLLEKMKEAKIQWPSEIKAKELLINVINQSEADKNVKHHLKLHVINLWDKYEKIMGVTIQEKSFLKGFLNFVNFLKTNALNIGAILFTIYLLTLISIAFFGKNEFLNNLANVEFARGLITFLFALGTISIALLIVISVFISDKPLDESKERFFRAKEILTILIGILGTIVGFYFGSPIDSGKQITPIELSAIEISNSNPVMGEMLEVSVLATGGLPPYTYTYSLVFVGGEDKIEKNGEKSTSGALKASFQIPKKNDSYKLKPILIVKDSKYNTCKIIGEKIEVKKQQK